MYPLCSNITYGLSPAVARRTAKSNIKGTGPSFRPTISLGLGAVSPKIGPVPGLCSVPAAFADWPCRPRVVLLRSAPLVVIGPGRHPHFRVSRPGTVSPHLCTARCRGDVSPCHAERVPLGYWLACSLRWPAAPTIPWSSRARWPPTSRGRMPWPIRTSRSRIGPSPWTATIRN